MSALSPGELLRKLVHMAVGLLAFLLAYLGPLGGALCALAAVLSNVFVLPRIGGKKMWREHETASGRSLGIVLYPLAVLLLILVFWRRLEIAAAIWGILAFGDGMASLVGMTVGGPRLPWNPRKTWSGSLAYVIFGTLGATTLLCWTVARQAGGGEIELGFAALACLVTALFAAFIESQPQGIDDNVSVPFLAGLVLLGVLSGEAYWCAGLADGLIEIAAIGAGVNLLLAGAAYAARSVDLSGAVMGFVLGTAIYAFLDWRGFLLLVAFFVLGTGTTKIGYAKKAAAKLAQEGGGRRSAKHAVANAGVAAVAAVFAATTGQQEIYLLAFAAAFATAAGDTVSSELGQLWGRRTFLLTTLKPVPRGTEGAVSLEGTVAGLGATLLLALLGSAVGFYGLAGVLIVTVAGFVGTVVESLAGATLEEHGLLDNEAINFFNTLVGALVAALLAMVLSR